MGRDEEVVEDDTEETTEDTSTEETSSEETTESADPIRAAADKAWDEIKEESKDEVPEQPTKGKDLRNVQRSSEGLAAKQGASGSSAEGGQVVDAPLSWRAEEKDLFKTLPPTLQQTLSRRESEREKAFNERMMQAAEYTRRYQGLEDVFRPDEQEELLRSGKTMGQVFGQFVATQRWLNRDPKEALKYIASTYNLSPQDLLDDDRVSQVDPRVQQLEAQLSALTNHVQGSYQQQYRNHATSVRSSIEAFAKETDANGQPLRPYFDTVYEDMLPIVERLGRSQPDAPLEKVISEAYDRAIYANPDVRAKVIAAEHAKRMQEEKKKADRARFAGSSVRGNPTAGAMTRTNGTSDLDTIIRDVWDDLST